MAIGSQNSFDGAEVLYGKVTGLKEGEDPTIRFTKKVGVAEDGSNIYKEITKDKRVAGDLIYLGTSEYKYKEDVIKNIHLTLADTKAGQVYKISCGLNGVGRSILNALGTVVEPGWIGISLGVNDKGFPVVWIRNNDELCNWKYDWEKDLNPLVDVIEKPNGKVERFYDKVDAKLLNEVLDPLAEKVKEKPAPVFGKAATPEPVYAGAPQDDPQQELEAQLSADAEDDLPF